MKKSIEWQPEPEGLLEKAVNEAIDIHRVVCVVSVKQWSSIS